MIRLNVGSGYLPLPGYTNIDLKVDEPNYAVDVICDIRKLKDIYKDNSVDEIFAKDVIEHVKRMEVSKLLQDFYDLLKPGGVLKFRVPDIDRIMDEYFTHREDSDARQRFDRMVHLIFGDQNFLTNYHLTAFRADYVIEDLEKMGFKVMPRSFDGGRDLRITAIKGDIEPLVTLDHPDYQYKELGRDEHRKLFYK